MLFDETLLEQMKDYCMGKDNLKLTVGLIKNGQTEIKMFNGSGQEENLVEYYYEIGCITKTFTASLLSKAVYDGVICLDDSIAKYVPELDDSRYYPTLRRLATHTSGCPRDTEEFHQKLCDNKAYNLYNDIKKEDLISRVREIKFEDKDYPWEYSNIGVGLLGLAIGNAYGSDYNTKLKEYLSELGMNNTYLGNPPEFNLNGFDPDNVNRGNWKWSEDCVLSSAGCIYSTITDLMKYAKVHMDEREEYLKLSHVIHGHKAKSMHGPQKAMGLLWTVIPECNCILHIGGTACFHTSLSIDTRNKKAVIILGNYVDKKLSRLSINTLLSL